jgi:hypothetical protein
MMQPAEISGAVGAEQGAHHHVAPGADAAVDLHANT